MPLFASVAHSGRGAHTSTPNTMAPWPSPPVTPTQKPRMAKTPLSHPESQVCPLPPPRPGPAKCTLGVSGHCLASARIAGRVCEEGHFHTPLLPTPQSDPPVKGLVLPLQGLALGTSSQLRFPEYRGKSPSPGGKQCKRVAGSQTLKSRKEEALRACKSHRPDRGRSPSSHCFFLRLR